MTTVAPVLDRHSPVPLVRQVHRHFERLIQEGRLAPGVKLPATRELARTLGVNRSTVAVAYEELVAGGWARAHVGQGTFVAEQNGAAPEGRPPGAAGARPRAPVDWSGLFSRSARHHRTHGAPADGAPATAGKLDLLRRRHAGREAVPHRGVPARAEPGRPGGGGRPAPVLADGRLPAAPAVPVELPAPVRRGGGSRGDPDRQRLTAGLRPDRPDPARPGRRRRHRAADLPPGHGGLPGVRGAAPRRPLGAGRAARGAAGAPAWSDTPSSSSTASRAPTTPPGAGSTRRSPVACWRWRAAPRSRSSRTGST